MWNRPGKSRKSFLVSFVAFPAAFLLFGGALRAAGVSELPPPVDRKVSFQEDVAPLFERCQVCHGEAQQQSGFRIDNKQDALKGGYSGPVILPGDSEQSRLVHLIAGIEEGLIMPPVGEKLTGEEVGIVRAWIDQGAKWPEPEVSEAQPAGGKQAKQEGEQDQAEAKAPKPDHWAFQPIERPEPPEVRNESWVRNPIDRFILARLERESVEPSPEADKETLMRRVSLDLTGLPPEPERVKQFLLDSRPDAYQRYVEELLDSEHYGEKWAIQWLDLARYGDSDGYEKDLPRPHAWRYRHWVINAFNQDMPFDEFTIKQIAGDLLPGASTEDKVATGFHRNTLTNREGGVKLEQFRFEETVDRANTVGTVWLGLTVGCAQCHDHKYDPISQKDYYRFYAFFNNLEEKHMDAPLPGELGPYLRTHDEYRAKRRELLEEHNVPELQAAWEKKLRIAAKNPGRWTDWDLNWDTLQKMSDGGHKILFIPAEERTEREKDILTNYFVNWSRQVYSKERYEEVGFKELATKLDELKKSYPQLSQARVVERKPDPQQTYLHVRGQWDRQGIEVEPDVLNVLPPLGSGGQATRVDLAKWLVSQENPLTARVTVNRIWQQYFGRGLVGTSENFGTQGEKPSHPKLLDWLASEFMDNGWRLKDLHRLIVNSAAYRQSSGVRPELQKRDPANLLLARQSRFRLPAELVRDNALAASGLLNDKVGGESVQPPLPKGVAMLGYAGGIQWDEEEGSDKYRRGVYIHLQRTVPYPFLANFDAPDGTVTVCQRERSNTPLQSLNLLNDPTFFEAAQALSLRVLQEAPGDGFQDRLDYAFRLCLAREANAYEQERLLKLYLDQQKLIEEEPETVASLFPADLPGIDRQEAAVWTGVSRILLNLDEFLTRE